MGHPYMKIMKVRLKLSGPLKAPQVRGQCYLVGDVCVSSMQQQQLEDLESVELNSVVKRSVSLLKHTA